MFMQKGRALIRNDCPRVMGRRGLRFCKIFTHHFQKKTAAKRKQIERCDLHHQNQNSKYFKQKITPKQFLKIEEVLYP